MIQAVQKKVQGAVSKYDTAVQKKVQWVVSKYDTGGAKNGTVGSIEI